MTEVLPRDLIGYGASRPDPRWPGAARLAGRTLLWFAVTSTFNDLVDALSVSNYQTVQLGEGRNQTWTKAEVEAELARTIGATEVVWLPRGLTRDYERYGTRGHVDIVATFTSPGRVLYKQRRIGRAGRTRAQHRRADGAGRHVDGGGQLDLAGDAV